MVLVLIWKPQHDLVKATHNHTQPLSNEHGSLLPPHTNHNSNHTSTKVTLMITQENIATSTTTNTVAARKKALLKTSQTRGDTHSEPRIYQHIEGTNQVSMDFIAVTTTNSDNNSSIFRRQEKIVRCTSDSQGGSYGIMRSCGSEELDRHDGHDGRYGHEPSSSLHFDSTATCGLVLLL